VTTGLFLNPGGDLGASIALAQRADALGYDSIWVTHGVGREALLTLSAYAHVAPRAGLGTGVIPIHPRHPVLLAQEALTLSEISRGRLLLGIGVSHVPSMAGSLGLDMARPLDVMREYVSVLRAALSGVVEHDGARYRAHWQSGVPRLPAPPPIFLAALGPRMLELAGEIADGVVLWLTAPDYIERVAVPAIRRGRERAGRTLAGFSIVAAVPAHRRSRGRRPVVQAGAHALPRTAVLSLHARPEWLRRRHRRVRSRAERRGRPRSPHRRAGRRRGLSRDRLVHRRPPRRRRDAAGGAPHRVPRRAALPPDDRGRQRLLMSSAPAPAAALGRRRGHALLSVGRPVRPSPA
jgi:alkanesulfonate monooxygenase SsuD/methylene tetrahydromethanopterin reductase-like flavin-dependent oxidoreductase (luciferase family)